MDRERALELLIGGRPTVLRWNRWRLRGETPPSLRRARLRHADLTDANLAGVDLEHADLEGANLFSANLEGARLVHANLRGADLQKAVLRSADLHEARMDRVCLCGTDLRQASLRGASLKGAQADEHSRWPEGYSPLKRGVSIWPGEEPASAGGSPLLSRRDRASE